MHCGAGPIIIISAVGLCVNISEISNCESIHGTAGPDASFYCIGEGLSR